MRKHVKTAGILLLLFAMGTVSLFATAPAEEDYLNEDGKIEVMFWTHGRHDLVFRQDQVERFNATNTDNIFVILESHVENITEEVNLAYEADSAPDIYSRLGGGARRAYAEQGRLADIEPLLSDEYKDRFESQFVFYSNVYPGPDGENILVTMPTGFGTTFRFIWNKELFAAAGLDPESPPETWDELAEYARIITEYGATQEPRKFGFAWPGVESDVWEYWLLFPMTDSGVFWFDYDSMEFNYSQYKPALEAYQQMVRDGSVFPGVLQLHWDPPRAQFSEGNIGMYFAASWDIGVFTEQFPAKIDWAVGPNPTVTGEKLGMTKVGGGTGAYYVNGESHPEVQQAAVTFIEFLYSLDEQVKYAEGAYGIPLVADIVAAAGEPEIPQAAGFFAMDDAIYPRWPPSVELEGETQYEVFNNIIFDRVDIDEALADLDKRMNDALQAAIASGDVDEDLYRIPGWTVPASRQ